MKNRQIILKSRPVGLPSPSDFDLIEGIVQAPARNEIVVRHRFLGLAPSARIRMREDRSYDESLPLGSVIFGQAVGIVEASRHGAFKEADKVALTGGGWQEYSTVNGDLACRIEDDDLPMTLWLGLLGTS